MSAEEARGCGDGGCVFRAPSSKGQHTNAGCRCLPLRMTPAERVRLREQIRSLVVELDEARERLSGVGVGVVEYLAARDAATREWGRANEAERERDEARAARDRMARILAVELGCSRYAPPGWGPDELWDDKWSCDRHDVVIRRVQRGRRRSGEHPDVWVAYGPGKKIGPQRNTALECMEAVIAEQAADAAQEVARG